MRCVRILLKLFHFIHAFPKNFIISIVNRNQLILSTGKRLYVLPYYIYICTYLWSCRELNILCIFCRHSLVHLKVAAAGETLLTFYIFSKYPMVKDLVQFLKCSMVGFWILFWKYFESEIKEVLYTYQFIHMCTMLK